LAAYADLRNVIEARGYVRQRRVGSHNTFRNSEGLVIVIPDHGSQMIVRSLLRKIIRDLGLGVDEYTALIRDAR
jgi:predicted RNA binding protein YcfA (HicA-like mRNA interferase family)